MLDDLEAESDISVLFQERAVENELIRFKNIQIETVNETGSDIFFHFCYNDEYEIVSSLRTEFIISDVFSSTIISIGLCVVTWYWMGYGCQRIILENDIGYVSPDMLTFWLTLYENVLREYLFLNPSVKMFSVENRTIPKFYGPKTTETSFPREEIKPRILVPLGGGKDSLVVWHQTYLETVSVDVSSPQNCSLRGDSNNTQSDEESSFFTPVSNPSVHVLYVADGYFEYSYSWRLQEIVRQTGSPLHLVKHNFHDERFERTARSYLKPCGHPWAALVLFDSVLVCLATGMKEVRLGFEKSSDFGNHVFYHDHEVNHQYDKSSSFVALAQSYINAHISSDIRVTSPLADMWDLQVAREFCVQPALARFHPLFLSCNEPIMGTGWCNRCEKCSFVFLMMSAWMSPPRVTAIFQMNYFEDSSFENTFLRLVGVGPGDCPHQKPFECVGTEKETRLAVVLTLMRYNVEAIERGRIAILPPPLPPSSPSTNEDQAIDLTACGAEAVPPMLSRLYSAIVASHPENRKVFVELMSMVTARIDDRPYSRWTTHSTSSFEDNVNVIVNSVLSSGVCEEGSL